MSSSDYGYNEQIADVIRPLGQGTVKKVEYGFRTIPNVEVTANATSRRVDATRIGTGNYKGTQVVSGQIQVVDSYGRKVMVMGYGKGMF